jgi:putative hydrolase of the HAD superfamily
MRRAVLFDLFETLVTESGTSVPRAGALGELFGLDPKVFRAEWKQLRPLVLRGQLSFKGALVEVSERLNAIVPGSLLQQACDERARARTALFQNIDPELLDMMRGLSSRGIRMAVVSNCMAEDVAGWPGSALAAHVECTMFSFRAGAVKPDRRIYLDAIDCLGVSPDDAIFVGDGGDGELEGARDAGLFAAQAAWFVTNPAPPGIPVLATRQDVVRMVCQ